MKTVARFILPLFLALLIVGTLFAVVIKDRPTAQSNGTNVVVRWSTLDEAGVQGYQVLRRTGFTGDFTAINSGTIAPKGNNSTYEFTDGDVFKVTGGLFQYKIRIVNGENPAPETEIVSVSHVSSTAKRTWGSIKAMFR